MHEWWQRMCSVLLGVTLGGCATVTTPATWQPGNVQPLISGWQQYFGILWSVTRQKQDSLIEGYITNTWGLAVREVQVLVNGYDSSGAQTGQVIAWGPNAIQPGDRVYFDVTVPSGAATYDVSVFSWKWTWPPSGGGGSHDEESLKTRFASNAGGRQRALEAELRRIEAELAPTRGEGRDWGSPALAHGCYADPRAASC